jgi:hypothetical protein
MFYTEAMRRVMAGSVPLLLLLLLAGLYAVEKQYQTGKILDAQQKARTRILYYLVNSPITRDEPYYELSIQLRDTVYVVEYTPRHSADTLPEDGQNGSEVQINADKRPLFVKRPGEMEADLVIVKHMPLGAWKAPPQDQSAGK